MLSNLSQKRMHFSNCSAVPVARISIGLAVEAPSNSSSRKFLISSSDKRGTFIPPVERTSVSITPGPPACVIMAIRFPVSLGCWSTAPMAVSSPRLLHRTMPAFRNNASTAISEFSIAPVWEAAARPPASDIPDFTAARRQPLPISSRAFFNRSCGFLMLSMYIKIVWGDFPSSYVSFRYSTTSSTQV